MQLPGRLRATTLGDLLGTLHRARATGTLELTCDAGRTHRVHLTQGNIAAVELDGASVPLAELLRAEGALDGETLRRSLLRAMASRRRVGEVLVADFRLAPEVVDAALRKQILAKLDALERLVDARVAYRVTLRPPPEALVDAPLGPEQFLAGRRRARDARAARRPDDGTQRARALLGVEDGADLTEVRAAFRRLVRAYHPDLHPNATEEQRAALSARFAEVHAAYRALVA
jgi:DnaJ-domain-containing protein 1